MEDYHTQGYYILRHCFHERAMQSVQTNVFRGIQQCIKELNTHEALYLSTVNRWRAPSPVTQGIDQLLIDRLGAAISPILGPEASCGKANVVFKNQYANDAIPAHQDIAYNKTTPYQMSCWLALTQVSPQDGAMYLYPQSHLLPIQGAVDFWSPDYQDELPKVLTSSLKEPTTITLNRGDVLLFDSRLWHGSHANTSGQPRIGVVTRWTAKDYEAPSYLPDPSAHPFGMWTCAEQTITILAQGLHTFYQEKSSDFLQLLAIWQQKLTSGEASPWIDDAQRAYQALDRVRILHLASKQHNAGDSYGRVYKNLWFCMLIHLVRHLKEKTFEL